MRVYNLALSPSSPSREVDFVDPCNCLDQVAPFLVAPTFCTEDTACAKSPPVIQSEFRKKNYQRLFNWVTGSHDQYLVTRP